MKTRRDMKTRLAFIMIMTLIPAGVFAAGATDINDLRFLKTSPQDGSAVVEGTDGKMEVVKVGDSLLPGVKIVEIGEGRVVLEEKTGEGTETVIISLEDGRQSVRRVRRHPGKMPLPYSPTQVEIRNMRTEGKP